MAKPCSVRSHLCLVVAATVFLFTGCERTGNQQSSLVTPVDRGDAFPPALPPSTPPPGETFEEMMARLVAEKPAFMARQLELLNARYDLSDRPSDVTMTRGRPVQE